MESWSLEWKFDYIMLLIVEIAEKWLQVLSIV